MYTELLRCSIALNSDHRDCSNNEEVTTKAPVCISVARAVAGAVNVDITDDARQFDWLCTISVKEEACSDSYTPCPLPSVGELTLDNI